MNALLPDDEVQAIAHQAIEATRVRCTDVGNEVRFGRLHRDHLRYCYPLNAWLSYDGRVWRRDASGEMERFAKKSGSALA